MNLELIVSIALGLSLAKLIEYVLYYSYVKYQLRAIAKMREKTTSSLNDLFLKMEESLNESEDNHSSNQQNKTNLH